MRNQKGFTIMETMIAMTILAMGLVAAVSLHYSTARNNRNANILTMCQMAAKAQIEVLRNQNIEDLVEGTFSNQLNEVQIQYTITKEPDNARLGRVIVTASLRNKTARIETRLNNYWGQNNGVMAHPGN